jgi:hypothetical protein
MGVQNDQSWFDRLQQGKQKQLEQARAVPLNVGKEAGVPYKVVKVGNGARPHKIINAQTGKVVGTSVTKAKALSSVRARMAAEMK